MSLAISLGCLFLGASVTSKLSLSHVDQTWSALLHAAGQGSKGEGRFCSLFSYPSWTRSLSLTHDLPSPIFPPCLGRPHRAAGREVHEEDFPLNHKLSLSLSLSLLLSLTLSLSHCRFVHACVCMLKWGLGGGGRFRSVSGDTGERKRARQQIISLHIQIQL